MEGNKTKVMKRGTEDRGEGSVAELTRFLG